MTDRRGNGLLADSYVPLVLLTPALADSMLDALGRAGIAAYAVTVTEESGNSGSDTGSTDHLYVDAEERTAAEEVLRSQLPGAARRILDASAEREPERPAQESPDEVWADLVSRFYESDSAERDWPDAENVSERDGPASAPDDPAEPAPSSRVLRPPEDLSDLGDDSDEERYVPPPPPPLPRGDLVGRLAWGGLLGAPALLLVLTLAGLTVPGWLVLVALCAFVTGFVVLLVRMGDRPSGPDDGAVI